jgi:hypothetical protein
MSKPSSAVGAQLFWLGVSGAQTINPNTRAPAVATLVAKRISILLWDDSGAAIAHGGQILGLVAAGAVSSTPAAHALADTHLEFTTEIGIVNRTIEHGEPGGESRLFSVAITRIAL